MILGGGDEEWNSGTSNVDDRKLGSLPVCDPTIPEVEGGDDLWQGQYVQGSEGRQERQGSQWQCRRKSCWREEAGSQGGKGGFG